MLDSGEPDAGWEVCDVWDWAVGEGPVAAAEGDSADGGDGWWVELVVTALRDWSSFVLRVICASCSELR